MRATRLRIHNFRSLKDVDIELRPYSLIVGPNNAGKSNTIDAIRVFYEKDITFEIERDFPIFETNDHESWIELVYKPSPSEMADLKDDYKLPDDTFCVLRFLNTY